MQGSKLATLLESSTLHTKIAHLFGVAEMTDFCGEEVTITDVFWIESLNAHGYSISEDCEGSTWCENCFVQEVDIAESDEDISVLFE